MISNPDRTRVEEELDKRYKSSNNDLEYELIHQGSNWTQPERDEYIARLSNRAIHFKIK